VNPVLITVEKLHSYIETELSDSVLEVKLRGLELMIRAYTHNNFQVRPIRSVCKTDGETVEGVHQLLRAGDTVEISGSFYNNGIYTVESVENGIAKLSGNIFPEEYFTVTKVEYPEDVVQGALNLLDWELNHRDKVGVQSESISRHSVTYFNMDGENSLMGYPKSLLGFLAPYKRARFGQGVHA
jgi:hypothetical protein